MGLVVPQTIRVKTSKKTCKHYREKGYEFEKKGDFIEVNVLDLYPGSSIKVKCICDVCGKEIELKYCHAFENNKNNRLIICNNPICVKRKIEDTCVKKYGEGIINPFQAESVKEKSKQTMLNNYGVEHAAQSEIIQDRMKSTNLKRYGCENAMQNKEIQNKVKATNLERHGVKYPTQNEEIKNKVLDSFQFNSTGPCSRVQKYIYFLIGGVLNKRVCSFLVDICFEKEKTAIEYDGSGHFLGELIINKDRSISKEAFLKEKQREDKIINNAYRIIRFIATKDRIPSDEVISNLVEGF